MPQFISNISRRKFIRTLFLSGIGIYFPGKVFAKYYKDLPSYPSKYIDNDISVRDYLYKMKNYDKPHIEDIILSPDQLKLLKTVVGRIKRLQQIIGHGNFNIISFDSAIKFSKNYSVIGSFTKQELNFMEMIFFDDISTYGFLGEKPIKNLTKNIKKKELKKIPCTGQFLYKDSSQVMYEKLKKIIGKEMILTSGVRNVIKQFYLFLNKASRNKGNLSLASRSLAPPGYSFHGIGDFDIGQAGFGVNNFTKKFIKTPVYKKIKKMGIIDIRYPNKNKVGVRYEPWHIKTARL